MPASHETGFVPAIVLAIVDYVTGDFGVAFWGWGAKSQVSKGVAVFQLLELKFLGVLPFGVAILLINEPASS